MSVLRVSHPLSFNKILMEKNFILVAYAAKNCKVWSAFKIFSSTPDIKISEIVFLADTTQILRTFHREFRKNPKNLFSFMIKTIIFQMKIEKKVVFWP